MFNGNTFQLLFFLGFLCAIRKKLHRNDTVSVSTDILVKNIKRHCKPCIYHWHCLEGIYGLVHKEFDRNRICFRMNQAEKKTSGPGKNNLSPEGGNSTHHTLRTKIPSSIFCGQLVSLTPIFLLWSFWVLTGPSRY